MKSYLYSFFIIAVCLAQISIAQTDTTKLFYAEKLESNAFAELGSNFIRFNKQPAMNIDFSVNWLVKHKYYIGVAYNQLASQEKAFRAESLLSSTLEEVEIKHQAAGLRFGYILLSENKIISISPDITGGWANFKWNSEENAETKHFGFVMPAAKLVFNVSDFFRVGGGIHYRTYFGLDTLTVTSKELNGVGGGIFLRIGSF